MGKVENKTSGLRPLTDKSARAQAIRSAGGKARAKKVRERKTIAEALRKVLDEQLPNSEDTRLDFIVLRALTNLSRDASVKDLKVLAEILGELKVTAENSGAVNLNITTTATSASLIQRIVNGNDAEEQEEGD